jgi:hypothetical protein
VENESKNLKRKAVVVGICLFVAGLHFVTGKSYSGPFREFINGYLIDILLPFCVFLLLGFFALKPLSGRTTRGIVTFAIGAAVETLQYFDIDLFGSTFDPLDYAMYVFGVFLGILFEVKVLSRI